MPVLLEIDILTYQYDLQYDVTKVVLIKVNDVHIMPLCRAFDLKMGFVENFLYCPIVPQISKCFFWSSQPSLKQYILKST